MSDAIGVWRAYIEALNRHDVEAVLEVVSEDVIYDERPMTMRAPVVGKERMAAYWRRAFAILPDLSIEILTLDVGRDGAWSESIMRGTQSGKVGWTPPSGKRMEARVACAFQVTAGKLAHERLYWDRANTLRQFGRIPAVIGLLRNPVVWFSGS